MLPLDDIVYVELVKHNLVYHLRDDLEPLSVRGSINGLERQLGEDSRFLQTSSGHLVNMDYVRAARGGEVVLSTGEKVPLSRARKRTALERLAIYLDGRL